VAARSHTVLARAPLVIAANEVTLQAPAEVIAGMVVPVTWTGPNNAGDYLTIVPKGLPDGQYGNYTDTSKGSPMTVTAPITPGEAEVRYMTGQGAKVLKRFPLRVVAAEISLSAPAAAAAGSKVTVTWTGPNNAGDYITLVPQSLPDGQYASYANTNAGSNVSVVALKSAGPAEIRYMSGQGAKVLKRIPIVITP
jgi:Ca-activated chloride channel family protein